jgi:hypothetical protein
MTVPKGLRVRSETVILPYKIKEKCVDEGCKAEQNICQYQKS